MRVAMVSSFPPKRCGIAEFSQDLCGALREAGHEVLRVGDAESSGADHSFDLGTHTGLAGAARAIEEFGAALIHLQWEPGLFSRGARLRLPKWFSKRPTPKIVTFHSIATLLERSARGRAALALSNRAEEALVLHAGARLTTTTHTMASLLARKYKVEVPDVTPLCVGSVRAPPPRLSAHPQYIAFGFVGHGKRLETVVELAAMRPDRHFKIAGAPAGPRGKAYAETLRESARGLANIILEIGWIADDRLQALVAGASATVLATPGEYRASASLTRSLSLGVPALAVKGSSIAETIQNTGAGALAKDASAGAFLEAIDDLESRYDEVCRGVLQAQLQYGWLPQAEALGRMYERAVAFLP